MEIFPTVWVVFETSFVFLLGSLFVLMTAKGLGVGFDRALILYFWHSSFCLLYAFYVSGEGGDALMYYNTSLEDDVDFSVGTAFVRYFTSFYSKTFGFDFVSVFFVFNILGSIGLLALDASLCHAVRFKMLIVRQLVSFLVFFPSISFWSSAIGKDAIVFMGICLALWASLDLRHRTVLMVLSVFIVFLVRPHIAGLMVVALIISFLFSSKYSLSLRLGFASFGLVASVLAVPFILEYVGLGGLSRPADLVEYLNRRQGYNQEGGGGLDISEMSLGMQLFTYLFRPLPFEAHGIASLMASLENLLLLALFVFCFLLFSKGEASSSTENRVFLWVYALSAWIILAVTTANLGISVRQKWMFLPFIIYILVSVLGRNRLSK